MDAHKSILSLLGHLHCGGDIYMAELVQKNKTRTQDQENHDLQGRSLSE